jgi:hypothetical protein
MRDAGPLTTGRHLVANRRFTRPLHTLKRRCGYDAISGLIVCLEFREEPNAELPYQRRGGE